jgi:type I restriction enzyme M protein
MTRAWTTQLWVYDLRTNMHFTQKQKPITRVDFDEFVECYKPGAMHKRKQTWSETPVAAGDATRTKRFLSEIS